MPPSRRHATPLVLVVAAAVAVLLAACSSEEGTTLSETGTDGPTVVVTTTIWGEVVERLVDDDATVEVLMAGGADPHDFEPSAGQAARVREADLVVANGLGLEAQLLDTIDAAATDGVVVIEVAPQLDPLPFEDRSDTDEHEHDDHDHEGDDPHVWLDPDRVANAAELLAPEVAEALGIDAAAVEERASAYATEVRDAALEAEDLLAEVPADQRVLVTNHDALRYFARRFDLTLVGVVIPGGSTLAEPSASAIGELADEIRERGVRAVFSETTLAPGVIEQVAHEAGGDVSVVELHTGSLGQAGTPSATYTGMIVENARLVADGLTGRADS